MGLDRRALLKRIAGLAAVLAAARMPGGFAQPAESLSAARFSALSTALTGFPPVQPSDVERMVAAFATPARQAALVRLAGIVADTPAATRDVAIRAAGLDVLADELVAAWYSGVAGSGSDARLVLYADAFMWSAMTFTKPMGVCGGVMGYWAEPPR